MSDPVFDVPREVELTEPAKRGSLALLRRREFRRLFVAVQISELGDAVSYIALMWLALDLGGPLGVVAVRLADSLPAFFFGLHGGVAADRWSRRGLMVSADVVRGAVFVPVAILGLTHSLPLWGLVVAAFVVEAATSYFEPAYGATIPAVVERENVQAANGLVHATANALSIGGWAVGALLLAVLPVSAFFAVDAASFFISGAIILTLHTGRVAADEHGSSSLRAGIAALKPLRALTTGVITFGVAMTIATGIWIGGIPQFVRTSLHHGAGGFSIVMIGFSVGAIGVGAVLARVTVRHKARTAMLGWIVCLPAYALIAFTTSLTLTVVASVFIGASESLAYVLLNSAAQEEVSDDLLGRVLGVISFVHRGSHATGLLLVSPLFAVVAIRPIFGVSALAVPLIGIAGALLADRWTGRVATA